MNIQPSEFWAMSPAETWLLYESVKPPEMVGKMPKDTFDKLRTMLH